jgi:hypothetical protein
MENEKKASPPVPAWGYLFAAACGIIPVLTLGGVIPGAIGFGGASACIGVARDSSKSSATRVAICVGITLLCWILVTVLLGGIAMFSSGS